MKINEKTREFIRQHQNDDVRRVALLKVKDAAIDLPMALQQIAGWQTARKKLPSWAAIEGIIYPPHLNMEQCSSEQTARYKATIVGKGETFVDLTGGLGVDFYWMSQGFKQRLYIEQNASLCAISTENFRTLGLEATVVCGSAADFLTTLDHADVIFLDPARRNEHGGRTYGIKDCTPNVKELLPELLKKAHSIVLKLSPMLDWRQAVSDIEEASSDSKAYVHEVHIVSVDNECKELLLVLSHEPTGDAKLVCVNNDTCFCAVSARETDGFSRGNQWFPKGIPAVFQGGIRCIPMENTMYSYGEYEPQEAFSSKYGFLYEPNSSIMKAGCFLEVEQRFPVRQLSANSHLFVSDVEIVDFPGRKFQISAISSMNKQELKAALADIRQANISVRNFPLSADELRKKLKLKDGGDVYIFATTLADGQHRMLICRKIG